MPTSHTNRSNSSSEVPCSQGCRVDDRILTMTPTNTPTLPHDADNSSLGLSCQVSLGYVQFTIKIRHHDYRGQLCEHNLSFTPNKCPGVPALGRMLSVSAVLANSSSPNDCPKRPQVTWEWLFPVFFTIECCL